MSEENAFESFDISAYFFGSYSHSIDSKSRIIIPNAYRELLGDTVSLTIDPNDHAINVYPEKDFKAMVYRLFQKQSANPALSKMRFHLTKYSFPKVAVDSQGRITLPTQLREYVLGSAKDIEISGAFDHLTITDTATATEMDEDYRRHCEEIQNEVAQLED